MNDQPPSESHNKPIIRRSDQPSGEHDENEVNWEDEMTNHADEYVELPEDVKRNGHAALNDFLSSSDYDEYPADWIEHSNRIAAEED